MTAPPIPALEREAEITRRAQAQFVQQLRNLNVKADRLFAWLTVGEWVVGVFFAIWVSPRAWTGQYSHVHFHVWAAVFLGAVIGVFSIAQAIVHPGEALTRHLVGASQMLMAGMLVHLTGGRIETHFMYFGLLAFIAFYRDWRVLMTATTVVGLDHLLRGIFWPQSVYGVIAASPWRTAEHVGWVVFEVIFLLDFIYQSRKELLRAARRQCEIELINEGISAEVEARTDDLKAEIDERNRMQRRLQLQNEVGLLLSSGAPIETIWHKILESICRTLDWEWSALWVVEPQEGVLRFATCWQADPGRLKNFEKLSRNIAMAPGVGLAGRIWAAGESCWVRDALDDPNFPRVSAAKEEGLRSAFGFPIRQEEDTVAVMEFLSDDIEPPDPELLKTFDALGVAMGTYIGRKQSESAMRESERRYRLMFENNSQSMWVFDRETLHFLTVNHAALKNYGYSREEFLDMTILDLQPDAQAMQKALDELETSKSESEIKRWKLRRKDGALRDVELTWNTVEWNGRPAQLTLVNDVTEREQAAREREKMELQLRQAQKLESIGQLAAGIAHEINTPIQYIGDNTRFLSDAFSDITRLVQDHSRLLEAGKQDGLTAKAVSDAAAATGNVDSGFLLEEIPKALLQTTEGIERVSTLVTAMKEFSHPGKKEKTPVDLNKAIETTITVARNEWKYVAEMKTEYDASLPAVSCLPGELNQVLLNLIVNAAHAIGDVAKNGDHKGNIIIRTRNHPDWVEIQVEDTGGGIPEAARSRIFDPFFTTKEVGKGTGQGLAIAHSVVVEKHGGSIHFKTQEGQGTTFFIRLPHDGKTLPAELVTA